MAKLTYAPHEFESAGFVKSWKVLRDGRSFDTFPHENTARIACSMPTIPGGHDAWPLRKVRAAAGAANPANADLHLIEPAEGPMRPGGGIHTSPLQDHHTAILEPLRPGLPPQHVTLPEGIVLESLPDDVGPFVGYRVLGLPDGNVRLLLVSLKGEWQSFDWLAATLLGPIRNTLQEALDDVIPAKAGLGTPPHTFTGTLQDAMDAADDLTYGMADAPPATPLERIATALERIAAAIEPPDNTGANINAILWTLSNTAEGIFQRQG